MDKLKDFIKRKWWVILIALVLLNFLSKSSDDGSFYGRYDLETNRSGYEMKEILDKYNAYIVLNKDGTIVLHSEMPGYPVVHRTGTFDEDPDKEDMTFIGTRFNDGLPPYSINIEGKMLKIGDSYYGK